MPKEAYEDLLSQNSSEYLGDSQSKDEEMVDCVI